MTALRIVRTGLLATVQDAGRPGLAALGVGASGAADLPALNLGNRLVANEIDAAGIEVTLGGLEARAEGDILLAVTGAPCPVTVDGHPHPSHSLIEVSGGATVRLGPPVSGLRSYLCVRGGIDVPPVLGSRSTDTLSGLGPDVLSAGTVLPVGTPPPDLPIVDLAPAPTPASGEVRLRVTLGPRVDWFTEESLETLLGHPYSVTPESDRVGMRLDGPALGRCRDEELPSEGMVAGSLQVPPSGRPTLFLADHPVTGGYPVIAVVVETDLAAAAQARPGQALSFRLVDGLLPAEVDGAAGPRGTR